MKNGERRVTVYDIAKEAGVSASTVSRVLTGNGPVNEKKRQVVLDLLKKHDFRPSSVARSLKARRSHSIGFIVPDIINPYFSTMFYEVETRLSSAGYTVILCNSESVREREMDILQVLAEKEVEAIVLCGGIVDDLYPPPRMLREIERIDRRVPIITLSKFPGVTCSQAYSDDRQGVFGMVDHLYGMGHRQIGMLGGSMNVRNTFERKIYLLEAANQYGMEVRGEWIIEGGFTIEAGEQAMSALLALPERPTAVLAFNDVVAVGALSIVGRHGLRVGHDIAVAGMDGIGLTEAIHPGITTAAADFKGFAHYVGDFVRQRGRGESAVGGKVFPYQIITRGSTRP